MITVSCFSKKDLVAVTLMKNGVLLGKVVSRITDKEKLTSNYLVLIECFSIALRNLRKFIEENTIDDEISFEFNNSTFIKWVNNGYSKVTYQKDFEKVYNTLQSIPLRYNLVMNAKPYASNFCKEQYLDKKVKLSSLED